MYIYIHAYVQSFPGMDVTRIALSKIGGSVQKDSRTLIYAWMWALPGIVVVVLENRPWVRGAMTATKIQVCVNVCV